MQHNAKTALARLEARERVLAGCHRVQISRQHVTWLSSTIVLGWNIKGTGVDSIPCRVGETARSVVVYRPAASPARRCDSSDVINIKAAAGFGEVCLGVVEQQAIGRLQMSALALPGHGWSFPRTPCQLWFGDGACMHGRKEGSSKEISEPPDALDST